MAALGAPQLRAGMVTLAVLAGIGLCLLTAAGLGLAAAFTLLRPEVGVAGALGILAAALLVVAQGLAWWLVLRRKPRAVSVAPPITDPTATPPDLGAQGAFLAGFLLARRLF